MLRLFVIDSTQKPTTVVELDKDCVDAKLESPSIRGWIELDLLDGWVCPAVSVRSDNMEALASGVWHVIEEAPKEYDLLLRSKEVVAVHRRKLKPLALARFGDEAYGDFGAFELAGLVVTFKGGVDGPGHKLFESVSRAGTLLEQAYREVSAPPPSWLL
jgi:hypothetical protein